MVSEIVDDDDDEFAAPIFSQIWHTTVRIFQQYWRTPSYIWGKILLGGVSALWEPPVECVWLIKR
jgi:ATP-binding cassette subfamily G (WHITE) protein 2 (PDR)